MKLPTIKADIVDVAPTMLAAYGAKMCTNNLLNRKDGYAGISVLEVYEDIN